MRFNSSQEAPMFNPIPTPDAHCAPAAFSVSYRTSSHQDGAELSVTAWEHSPDGKIDFSGEMIRVCSDRFATSDDAKDAAIDRGYVIAFWRCESRDIDRLAADCASARDDVAAAWSEYRSHRDRDALILRLSLCAQAEQDRAIARLAVAS